MVNPCGATSSSASVTDLSCNRDEADDKTGDFLSTGRASPEISLHAGSGVGMLGCAFSVERDSRVRLIPH
jgi:hypothetical protein